MIAFFPEPYPDELAYSLFTRYHVHSGNMTFSATAKDLFQCKDAIPNPEFFAPLSEEVCSIITRSISMESFIEKHTMLPYYIRFLPLERRCKAKDLLLAMDRAFYDAIYVRQKKSERRQYMRYCPMCAAADREQHGETYWHRKHQLPGVEICMEHRCRLENSSNGITVESQRFKLIHAEMVIPQYTPVNLDVSDLEYQLSDYVMQIFDADMDFDSDVSTGKFLQSRLEGTPYTSLRGEQVFARKLFAALSEHYQELPQNTLEAWWYVQKVFCSQNFHTFDVCLIALFLGIPINDLLHMTLPELTLQQRFDNQLRLLRSQGMTQKQAAEHMGVTLDTIKSIEQKRWKKVAV